MTINLIFNNLLLLSILLKCINCNYLLEYVIIFSQMVFMFFTKLLLMILIIILLYVLIIHIIIFTICWNHY